MGRIEHVKYFPELELKSNFFPEPELLSQSNQLWLRTRKKPKTIRLRGVYLCWILVYYFLIY